MCSRHDFHIENSFTEIVLSTMPLSEPKKTFSPCGNLCWCEGTSDGLIIFIYTRKYCIFVYSCIHSCIDSWYRSHTISQKLTAPGIYPKFICWNGLLKLNEQRLTVWKADKIYGHSCVCGDDHSSTCCRNTCGCIELQGDLQGDLFTLLNI